MNFITRDTDGRLILKRSEWANFRNGLLSVARTQRELEFIGQLIDDLQNEYEERLEEFEGMD